MKSFNFNIFYVLNQLRSLWFLKNLFEIKYHFFLINHNFQTVLVFFKVWIFQDHSFDEGKKHVKLVQYKHEYTNMVKIQDYCGIKDGLSVLFFVFNKVSNSGFKQHVCWFTYHELFEPFLLFVGNDIVKPTEFSLSKNIRKIIHCFSNSNYGCYHQRETNWNVMIWFNEP